MASDRQQFNRINQVRQEFIDAKEFSLAPEDPRSIAAVLVPHASDENERRLFDPFPRLAKEAEKIAHVIRSKGKGVEVHLGARPDDFLDVLTNRAVSSIIICGYGGLSRLMISPPKHPMLRDLPTGNNDGRMRWTDAALLADHLKRGPVIQRFCGRFNPHIVNVPFSWGIVTDHRNIYAPVGETIDVFNLHSPLNGVIRPITDKPYLSYDEIRNTFTNKDETSTTQAYAHKAGQSPSLADRIQHRYAPAAARYVRARAQAQLQRRSVPEYLRNV